MSAPARLRVVGLGMTAPGALRPEHALELHGEAPPDWFDAEVLLPGRGYRKLPPGCRYLLAAARSALADTGAWFADLPAQEKAAVIGGNNAGATLQDDFDHTVIATGAADLSPARVPYMALSMFAGRLAPEHGLRAFSLAANSPAVAGLEALQTAARALAAGRATAVLAGAVEDRPAQAQGGGAAHDVGAAVLVCVSEGAPAAGELVYGHCSVRGAFVGEAPGVPEVSDVLDPLWKDLAAEGPPLARIDAVLDDSPAGEAVAAWLTARAGDRAITAVARPPGSGSLAPLRRVVGRLAAGPPERAVVLAVSAHGHVAMADVVPSASGVP
ncbi:beta-ketoacyl synthase N-terminal-like domain-containing protein [Yinghuangia seranimata]|uniref:beta-ketoacyl synthase N-terminal-like domain-containing protein n=1 Tax=Yinghuangia seranimata TaxID=408067 RepID=UPI00248BD243|nr:beta-ketoacyl synthase N-terminal-like domain-containing protein [Yinghuangia seranimata]MDI2125662.1 beta-ketoacyl synthase N-terminal-like domain-containing protein [Yinghuangia seranimata]